MTDDERMDRARRIREMREGSRPQDDASNDDQSADSADDDPSDAGSDGAADDTGGSTGDVDADAGADESTADADGTDTDASADPTTDGGDADGDTQAEDGGDARTDERVDPTDADEGDTGDESIAADADDETAGEEASDDEGFDDAESAAAAAAAAAEAATELDDGEESGTIHIPGADVGDVEVDVEEMARQAGLSSADGAEDEADGEAEDGSVDPVAPGAASRADGAETQTGEETRVLEFALGDEQYCLDIEYVEEIVKRETVTRVPNTADCVEGVVDLRGQITTILDPKVLLDIPEEGSKGLIVVFDPDEFDDQGAVGWVVDDVNQVTPITEDEVNASPVDQDHVNGVVDRDGEFVIWTTPELDLDEATG